MTSLITHELGDGTTMTRLRPVLVSGLTGATHLAAGLDFGVVRRADGTLRAWGRNDAGQLGASSSGDCGGTACSLSPLVVGGLTGAATAVAGGFGHSLTSTVAVGLTGGTTTYAYDRLSRLTGVTVPTGTTTYTYDPVGNRTTRTRTGTTNVSYIYDRADRIKTVVQGATTTYTVNANGNLTARGNDDFTYDQANRLKTAVVGGVTSSSGYDGDGKRVSQTVGGSTSRYVYDVNAGLPVLLDDGGRKYVWGLGLAYAVSGSNVEVYHTDGLGSVRALTDGTGALIQTQATDEFGVPTGTMGTSGQPFGYTGEPRDSATGLVYLRARMYDPATGRFIQRDVFAGMLASPLSLHRYAYVQNNPVNLVDPTGLDSRVKESPYFCQWLPKNAWEFLTAFEQCARREMTGKRESQAQSICRQQWSSGGFSTLLCSHRGDEDIESIDEVLRDPHKLRGKTPADLIRIIAEAVRQGWRQGTLGRGSQKGHGFTLREVDENGNLTGRLIQYHPGGGHHGSAPYWKVSSPEGGITRVGPQFP